MLSEVNIEPFQTPFLYMPAGREKERKKKRERERERERETDRQTDREKFHSLSKILILLNEM